MGEKFSNRILVYTSPKGYVQHRIRFEQLNYARILHFLLPVAAINFLLAVLPSIYSLLTLSENLFTTNLNLLVIRLSLSLSLVLLYAVFYKSDSKKITKNSILLGKLFVLVVLVHTMGVSLADALTGTTVSSFLLGICGILVGLYWPPKRQITYIGGAIILYWIAHYLLYNIPYLFLTQLTGQLLFVSVFYMLSNALLQSKAEDFNRMQSLQTKSVELKQSHEKLRRTEHALSSLKQHTKHGLFRLKRSHGFTYANEYLADMLGFSSPSELLKSPRNIAYIAVQDLDNIARKVNQQGFIEGAEMQLTRRNGTQFWALLSCSIYTDPEARDIYYEGTVTDITYRKKALQEALNNATKLEQAEKIANTGFYEICMETARFTYSAGYCAILGITSSTTISLQEHLAYILPEQRAKVKSTLLHSLTKAENYRLTYQIKSATGQIKSLVSRGQVLQDEQGENYRLLGTVQDITQLQANKNALEKSEAIIRTAFNYNSNFGICILDNNLAVLEFNEETARRLVGWQGTQIKKGLPIHHTMHPETVKYFQPVFEKALNGETSVFEYQPRGEIKHDFWAEFIVGPVHNRKGLIIGVLIIAVDISQRKRQEKIIANLSLVASHTDNAVMISDRKHRVEWVNEAFTRQTGYTLDEIQGRYPKEFMVSNHTDITTLTSLNNALREGRSFNNEIQLCTRTKESMWVQVTINPVYNSRQKAERFVSIYTDLSQRKKFEDQLEEAKTTAERSVEAKDHFLSTVSHELRTPLNGVIGLTYHLLQNQPRPDQEEDLNTLKFSAENLLSLINDILDLSKMEAGKVKLQQMPFSIQDILNNLTHSFSGQAKNKGLQLSLDIDPSVPKELIGDSRRLTQILTNLLGNALKFTHEGTIDVRVNSQQQNPDLVLVSIEVEDTGIGIEEEKLNTIFLKFEQATQFTSSNYGGTGLGLAIVKQLIELQGGIIAVNSKPGQGTKFVVSLPYSISSNAILKQVPQEYIAKPDKSLKQLNILLAEDNLVNQAVAKKFMDNWDIRYTVADNGHLAVEAARQQAYNLILMDLQMPEMDGFEATRKIRNLSTHNYSNTPIIAITAGGSMGISDKLSEAGLTDIILKPFTPNQLLMILKKYSPDNHPQKIIVPTDIMQKLQPDTSAQNEELDISGIATVAGGDAGFMQELLKLYIQQFIELPREIEAAQLDQDRLQLRRIFHKLRPSVVMLKASRLQAMGDDIHQALHDAETPFNVLSTKLDQYCLEMHTVLAQLEQIQHAQLNPA